jgi:ribosome maturation factor RimP
VRSDDLSERVRVLVGPSLEASGLELFDVELSGGVLRVTVDRPGGVDLDAISAASQQVSSVLDQHDDLIPGRYLLEVSSPGIERNLRRPEHFRGAIGSTVAVKTRAGSDGERRVEGVLEAADDEGVVVAGRALSYDDIERARTRFVWPQPTRKAGAPR